jgi:hypothetical protein
MSFQVDLKYVRMYYVCMKPKYVFLSLPLSSPPLNSLPLFFPLAKSPPSPSGPPVNRVNQNHSDLGLETSKLKLLIHNNVFV